MLGESKILSFFFFLVLIKELGGGGQFRISLCNFRGEKPLLRPS